MATIHIAAKDARIGDRIFNNHAMQPGKTWTEVVRVEFQPGGRVHLVTARFTESYWQEDQITVDRPL